MLGSQTSEQPFLSVYHAYSVHTEIILCGYLRYTVLYKENGLQLT
jgi:hypothetical protein